MEIIINKREIRERNATNNPLLNLVKHKNIRRMSTSANVTAVLHEVSESLKRGRRPSKTTLSWQS